MKRSAVIIAVLLLLLFNMPVYAASGYSDMDDEVEEKALVSAYGYSGSYDEDKTTSSDNGSVDNGFAENKSTENEPADNGSADADKTDAVVYAFVSSDRLASLRSNPVFPNQDKLQESGKEVMHITIDDQTEIDVRKPATFMFLIDQSDSMKESGLGNALSLIEDILQYYSYSDSVQPNYFFRGSKDGDFDNIFDLMYGFLLEDCDSLLSMYATDSDATDSDAIDSDATDSDAIDSDATDSNATDNFYQCIDDCLEDLSRNMREDSDSGWGPGSITNLVLLTDRDPEVIRNASTKIAKYPEIVVHTACFSQESYSENDTLFSGSTGVQEIIAEEADSYGREAISTGTRIASFIDGLILYRYRFKLDPTMGPFSVRLTNGNWNTNILENVRLLDGEASEDEAISGEMSVKEKDPDSRDDSTGGTTPDSEGGNGEETTTITPESSDKQTVEDTTEKPTAETSQTDSTENPTTDPVVEPSGGLNIPLIAGIACGVLALIILLIVLLRRRDGDNDIGRTSGPTVPDKPVKPVVPEVEDELPDVVEARTEESEKPTVRPGRKEVPMNERRDNRPSDRPAFSAGRETFADAKGLAGETSGSTPKSVPGKSISIRIEEIEGNYVGKKTEFSVTRELLIGNDPTQCDIVFVQEGISPRHSRIYRKGEKLFIEDLGSEGGTYLDGMRLFAENRLRSGDEIGIGFAGFTIRFI